MKQDLIIQESMNQGSMIQDSTIENAMIKDSVNQESILFLKSILPHTGRLAYPNSNTKRSDIHMDYVDAV